MAAHERDDVTRSGIGHRNPRVGCSADRRRYTRHDLERNALFVEQQRFLAAAVEHERIPPFQSDDDLAIANLLRKQDADRLLVEHARGSGADIDPLGIRAGEAEQPRWNQVIVNDHVRAFQQLPPADGDQRRIARTGADDVDARLVHV